MYCYALHVRGVRPSLYSIEPKSIIVATHKSDAITIDRRLSIFNEWLPIIS